MTPEQQHEYELHLKQATNALAAFEDEDVNQFFTEEDYVHLATESITFENCNKVAHQLGVYHPDIAKALYDELKYWIRND